MRTKTLLMTAALTAAGVTASMAQGTVFSANAVGFVNTTVGQGFTMISNPLDAEDNSVPALFGDVMEGTSLFKFDPAAGQYEQPNSLAFGEWSNPAQTLEPGEGAFIQSPAEQTITFVGEVRQGDLTHNVPTGFSMQSSEVPQEGGLVSLLEYPVEEGDAVFQWDAAGQQYAQPNSFVFGEWSGGGEPVVGVGEAFFIQSSSDKTWDRTFSVND